MQWKGRRVGVVGMLRRGRDPTLEVLLGRIGKCTGLARCSRRVCGDRVGLSSGMLGYDRNVASPHLV